MYGIDGAGPASSLYTMLGDKIPVEQQLNIRTTDEEMVHLLAAHGQTRALTFFQVIHPGSANSSCMPVTCIHFSDRECLFNSINCENCATG